MKKTPGGIIILHTCTKNYDQIMYDSWEMMHDGRTGRRKKCHIEVGAPPKKGLHEIEFWKFLKCKSEIYQWIEPKEWMRKMGLCGYLSRLLCVKVIKMPKMAHCLYFSQKIFSSFRKCYGLCSELSLARYQPLKIQDFGTFILTQQIFCLCPQCPSSGNSKGLWNITLSERNQ